MENTAATRAQLLEEIAALEQSNADLAAALTRAKRLEEGMMAQSARFRAILESYPDVLYVTDPTTYEVLFVNRVFADALGRDPHGEKCYAAFQGLEEPCAFCTNEIILHNDRQSHTWEHYNEHLDRHFRITDRLIKWPDGRDVRFEVALDTTAHKRAERELRIKNLVFEASIAAGSIADNQGLIHTVNDAFVDLWGFDSKEDALGNSVGDFFVEPERAAQILKALHDTGSWQGEFLAKKKDGTLFISRGFATVIHDEAGEQIGYQSANIDVTAEREAQTRLEKTLAELARSNEDLAQFAYVASHDLQEPLRVVTSFVQLLAKRYGEALDDQAKEYIAYAVDGAGRMKTLIDDLLSFSRVNTQGRPLAPVQAGEAARQALRNLDVAIEEAGAQVTVGDLPDVRADRTQLVQLLQNLIANAVKFARAGIAPQVTISAERRDDEWVISVTDNGIGIEEQFRDRIFVIFQRLHGRGDYGGTGIGLAVCKRIVERHGGRIWVEPPPGEGCTFRFTLPA